MGVDPRRVGHRRLAAPWPRADGHKRAELGERNMQLI